MSSIRSEAAEIPAQRLRSAADRALIHLLEGSRSWGRYEVSLSRSGVTRYRLVVYPPGTSAAERRALTRARDWPVLGALAALLAMMALGELLHPLPITLIALTGWLAGIAITRSRVKGLRKTVRTLDAVEVMHGRRRMTRGRLLLILALAHALTELDGDLRAGRITVLEHELRWAELYARAA